MSAREEAQRFLDQLRRTEIRPGTSTARLPPDVADAIANEVAERFLRDSITPEQRQDPETLALVKKVAAARAKQSVADIYADTLSELQDDIETTAAARIQGLDLEPLRPLVGYLQTGQLNAICMRVPRSSAYLVLFEDQMPLFSVQLSEAVVWAIPHGPAEADGRLPFKFSRSSVMERIDAVPEVTQRFSESVVAYAAQGRLSYTTRFPGLPPGYARFAEMLSTSLEYFVLGHEFAHILHGHLDTAKARTGALPISEAEIPELSWAHEFEADLLGMVLSINAGIEKQNFDSAICFAGVGLFFDALEVMDRAVALLETGDESVSQLGSHPPSELRKQRLREFWPKMGGGDVEGDNRVRTALEMEKVQGEIVRLLWERTRPILLDLHRRGVRADLRWRPIAKETGPEAAPSSQPDPKRDLTASDRGEFS